MKQRKVASPRQSGFYEIGCGGPACPRAYFRLERGDPEPQETSEKRSHWHAPPTAVSDVDQNEAVHADESAGGETGAH